MLGQKSCPDRSVWLWRHVLKMPEAPLAIDAQVDSHRSSFKVQQKLLSPGLGLG
jgi:hypothetical protein